MPCVLLLFGWAGGLNYWIIQSSVKCAFYEKKLNLDTIFCSMWKYKNDWSQLLVWLKCCGFNLSKFHSNITLGNVNFEENTIFLILIHKYIYECIMDCSCYKLQFFNKLQAIVYNFELQVRASESIVKLPLTKSLLRQFPKPSCSFPKI